MKNEVAEWLGERKNHHWKQEWAENPKATKEMEDGPPTKTPEDLIDAIKNIKRRWICIRAFRALAKIKGKDIVIVTGGKGNKYSLHTWVKKPGREKEKR